MARFSGLVGFAHTERTAPGVSSEVIVEMGPYYGEVKRASRTLVQGDTVNPTISLSNTIEIVADEYASENIYAIRYVLVAGTPWIVAEAAIQRPRLLLRLGGVYHGPRPSEASPPPTAP